MAAGRPGGPRAAAQRSLLLEALLLLLAAGDSLQRGQDANLAWGNPVRKVVALLQDMSTELQKELEDDKAVYELLSCWCKTNEQEKTQAIDLGVQTAEQLEASLSADAAKVVELKEKRKQTMDGLYADQKALDSATAIRMDENKAFHGEETDLIQAVEACKQSIVVLGKHHAEFAQVQSAAQQLKKARVMELAMAAGAVSGHRGIGLFGQRVLKEFFKTTADAQSFLAVPGFQSYAPVSGQVFGILKEMQSDFEESLSESQKAEAKAQKDFESLRAAKQDEIESAKREVTRIDQEVAFLGEKAAQEAQQLQDTKDQLALDREFMKNLKIKCSMTDEEFAARTKSRQEEIVAVQDTIKILNEDKAFDLFGKSVPSSVTASASSFLQTRSAASQQQKEAALRARAATLFRRAAAVAAKGSGRGSGAGRDSLAAAVPRLALLEASVQIDAFTTVKAEIDKLVAELSKQQQDEVAHRDWCIAEMNDNKLSTEAGFAKQTSLESKKADLEKDLEAYAAKLKELAAAGAEVEAQMKKASEIREAENADAQETIGDQMLTQQILQKAVNRMAEVYALMQQQAQQPGAPHIQTSGNHTDPGNGPARFSEYAPHAGGQRVVAMLEQVIADSKKTEAEAIASEEDAQSGYEGFMKESNKALTRYAKSSLSLSEATAKAKEALSMTETDLSETLKELEGLHEYLLDLQRSCEYLLVNFGARQEARAAEIAALREAKAVLSGMQ